MEEDEQSLLYKRTRSAAVSIIGSKNRARRSVYEYIEHPRLKTVLSDPELLEFGFDPVSNKPIETVIPYQQTPENEPSSDPATVTSSDPATVPSSDPTTESFSEPSSDPVTEPFSEPFSDPSTEPSSEPGVEPSSEPAIEPSSEPTVEPCCEPAVGPCCQSAVGPCFEPAAGPCCEPAAGPSCDPVAGPSGEPATLLAVDLTAIDQSNSSAVNPPQNQVCTDVDPPQIRVSTFFDMPRRRFNPFCNLPNEHNNDRLDEEPTERDVNGKLCHVGVEVQPQQNADDLESGNEHYHDGPPNLRYLINQNNINVQINIIDLYRGIGMRNGMPLIFIAGEMAGIGMLITPWAIINLGWFGLFCMVVIAGAAIYSSSFLGKCWLLLEERIIEFQSSQRINPYFLIAKLAYGKWMHLFLVACTHLTLLGASTVYLMIIAQLGQQIFKDSHPEITFQTWLFVFSITLSSMMFMESPRNYSLVSIFTLLLTMTACFIVTLQMVMNDANDLFLNTVALKYTLTPKQICMSLGTLLFAFGGAASFPVLQNDKFKKNEFTQVIVTSFTILAILYVSIVLGGMVIYSNTIKPMTLDSLDKSLLSQVAVIFMFAHLIVGFLTIINPIPTNIERYLHIDPTFNLKRFGIRVSLLLSMIIIGNAIENFQYLVTILGCTTIAIGTFILPSIFYLKLSNDTQGPHMTNRVLKPKTKLGVYLVLAIGVLSSLLAIGTAILTIDAVQFYIQYMLGFWPDLIP